MMYPYPDIFDDLITKVKIDIKRTDPLPKHFENIIKEEIKEEKSNENSESESK